MDLSQEGTRSTPRCTGNHRIGSAHGEGEHLLGLGPDPRRTRQARPRQCTEYRQEYIEKAWHRTRAGVTTAPKSEFMKQVVRNLTDVGDGFLLDSECVIIAHPCQDAHWV